MSIEIAIAENTAAIRDLIAALSNGIPVTSAQVTAIVEEAAPAAKVKKADPKPAATRPAEETQAVDPETAAESPSEPVVVSREDVTKVVLALGSNGKRAQLVELLGEFGAKRGGDLTDAQLGEFHVRATALLEG